VVLCISGNYWSHAAVVIASTVAHEKNLEFVVFHDAPGRKWQDRISRKVDMNSCSVVFQNINIGLTERFQTYGHLAPSTYYRLFVPEILDSNFSRFLYLDSDLVVLKSLKPLLSIDLQGRVLAARPFFVVEEIAQVNKLLKRPLTMSYFNAGVCLIDRARWVSDKITEKAIDLLVNYPERISMADQCAINYAIEGDAVPLGLEWNVTMQYWYPSSRATVPGLNFEDLVEARNNPAIVHFNGPTKPWQMADTHPCKHFYSRVRRRNYEPFYIAEDFSQFVGMKVRKAFQVGARFAKASIGLQS
jgi:lipopolysaccharide biosynthesis glycosyltransferase